MLRWNSIHSVIPNCKRLHLNPDIESTKGLKPPSKEYNFNYKSSKTLQDKFYKEEKLLLFGLWIATLSGDKKIPLNPRSTDFDIQPPLNCEDWNGKDWNKIHSKIYLLKFQLPVTLCGTNNRIKFYTFFY